MSPEQVFCDNWDCSTFCWDWTQTRDWNLANATYHDLSALDVQKEEG